MNRDWLEKDFYASLGVGEQASVEDIKKAYKGMARDNHPDLNPGDAEAEKKFKEISEAYAVLSDPNKRQEYDQVRAMGAGGFGGFGGQGFRVDDFGDLFGSIGDIFGGFGGQRSTKGQTYQTDLTIAFDEAAMGVETSVGISKEIFCEKCRGNGADKGTALHKCNICNGSGQVASNQGFFSFSQPCNACKGQGNVVDKKCSSCKGYGKKIKNENIKVKIPSGVDTGTVIRLRGQGGEGRSGAPDGDLLVNINVERHRFFKRSGADLLLDVPITFIEAALGTTISVPTLNEDISLKIPPGTPSGKTFRVKGKGITPKGRRTGDFYVKVGIVVPEYTRAAKRELQKFKDKGYEGDSPREYLNE